MPKILVTGGSGLIGNAVVRLLIEKGFEVNILDLYKIDIKSINYFRGTILSPDDIDKAMRGCDYVIHLAAMLGVAKSTYRPIECLDVNVIGTKNILESCVKNRIKKVVFSSSSEVYGEPIKLPVAEDAVIQPKSEYGISKVVGEEYFIAYKRIYDLDYTILRFFNVYGIRQGNSWVVSRFTNSAVLSRPVIVYGDGNQIRTFCFDRDAAEGTISALFCKDANNDVFNIGNSEEKISIKDLAKKVLKIAGRTDDPKFIPLEQSDRSKDREVYKRLSTTEKAKKVFGFEPKIVLSEGLKELIEFKKAHIEAIKEEVEMVEKLEREFFKN